MQTSTRRRQTDGRSLSRRQVLLTSVPCISLMAGQQTRVVTNARLVSVFATVRDKHGHLIRGLKPEDFIVKEDGRLQVISQFSFPPDAPLIVGLLIDTSRSMQGVFASELEPSYTFCSQVLRKPCDQMFIMHFDEGTVGLIQPLTSSTAELRAAFDGLLSGDRFVSEYIFPTSPARNQRSGLYDAIIIACDQILARVSGRKVLIIVSDASHVGSRESLASISKATQQNNMLIYTFPIQSGPPINTECRPCLIAREPVLAENIERSEEKYTSGRKGLYQMSIQTGASPSRGGNITHFYGAVLEELHNQYVLGYVPNTLIAGGEYRTLDVSVRDKALIVHARHRYYVRR
jgi:VWFA-related protein